jgi:hypothetical protein
MFCLPLVWMVDDIIIFVFVVVVLMNQLEGCGGINFPSPMFLVCFNYKCNQKRMMIRELLIGFVTSNMLCDTTICITQGA